MKMWHCKKAGSGPDGPLLKMTSERNPHLPLRDFLSLPGRGLR